MEKKTIVLAGGCFWGMEKLCRSLRGVIDVTAGYANGRSPELANYQAVCSGITGFREAVRVVYDPAEITLRHLLFAYYAAIDPTMWHRQGMDMGSQYQTGKSTVAGVAIECVMMKTNDKKDRTCHCGKFGPFYRHTHFIYCSK